MHNQLLSGVSVITAVGPSTSIKELQRCIDSVQIQLAEVPIEHIIVFDGIAVYERLKHLIPEEHLTSLGSLDTIDIKAFAIPWAGPGVAKMHGIAKHSYSHIIMLDADDELYNDDTIEELYKVAIATNADIVQGSVMLENGKMFLNPTHVKYGAYKSIIESKREVFERCKVFDKPVTHGKLINSLNVKLAYNTATDMCDESYCVVEAMYSHSIALAPLVAYVLHDSANSISKSQRYEKLLAIRKYRQWAKAFGLEHGLPLPDKYFRQSCKDFSIFGFRVLRINKFKYKTQFYLFNKLIWELQVGV